ncbi:MAG: NAD(+) synthase [Candidatus Altimarinota bacterium]
MALSPQQIESVIHAASQKLAEYCMESDLHCTVTGVSGGLDSAVTLALSQKASEWAYQKGYRLQTLGLILPCHSDPEDAVLAKKVIQAVGAQHLEIDLTGIFDAIESGVLRPVADELVDYHQEAHTSRYRTAQGNVKARLRMALGTYYVANLVNGLVLSTDNYSEYWMGFWTLHGDVGDYGMIQELWKGDELPLIAEALGIPAEVIQAAPKDGLGVLPGGDEAQLGAGYPVVDRVLLALMKQGIDLNGKLDQLDQLPEVVDVDTGLVRKIAERALKNAFKRRNPFNLSRRELGL